ncbi:Type 1 glutamine amidotransferase-like domain-containing protein [Patescibacteria group bacterium]|nr:Type 1 glutamine amidotransferase-like domain-containing protein [Patescibacteria group bacterium]
MKLYLSSYHLGNHPNEFKKLINRENPRVAVSVNALDFLDSERRNEEFLDRELKDMKSLGFSAEELDLRDYFHNNNLAEKMKEYDAVWFSGGNVFILAKAFKQSGFDKVIEEQVKTGNLVYAGYSAAFCVLTTSLHGIELVDDKDAIAEGYEIGEIWEGIGLIDFYPIVHFRSDHEESELVEKEYEYVVKNNISHKTFKDGEVYFVDGEIRETLT